MLDPVADVGFECLDALVGTALQELGGEVGEPAFYLVDPGGSGRGEVDVEAGWRASQSPTAGVLWVA